MNLLQYLPHQVLVLFVAYLAYKKLSQKIIPQEKEISLLESLKTSDYQAKPHAVWIAQNGLFFKVPVNEVEKKHHFQWKEDIFTTDSYNKAICWGELLGEPNTAKLQYCLNHTEDSHDKFALKYFDNEIGWGVVAKEELNQPGNILTYYAGKIKNDYSSPNTYNMHIVINGRSRADDAHHFGNISRFMMHLPAEEEQIELPGVDLTKLARANCKIKFVYALNSKIPTIAQIKPIQPNEVIGYSYGSGYWRSQSFWLVEKDGTKIAKAKYDGNNKIGLA